MPPTNTPPKSIAEAFARAEAAPRRAWAQAGRRIDYGEVCDIVRRLAAIFAELGLKPGDPGFTRQTRVTFGFERGRLAVVAEAAPKAKRVGKAVRARARPPGA
jgi:hypothetical protein